MWLSSGVAVCADIAAAYIDQIQKKEITATCDQATGVCNIAIQDFPIQLETPCKAGDCVSDKNPVLNQGASFSAFLAAA